MKTIKVVIVFTLMLVHYACSSQIYSKHRSKVVKKHSNYYDFYKEYYGEYAKKNRVDNWHNVFLKSNIKILAYSYLGPDKDIIFTVRFRFSKDGCLDSVLSYQTFKEYTLDSILMHNNEIQRLQTFYKNGFYKEHGYYSGTFLIRGEDHRLYIKPNKCYYYEKDSYSSDNVLKMGKVIDSSGLCGFNCKSETFFELDSSFHNKINFKYNIKAYSFENINNKNRVDSILLVNFIKKIDTLTCCNSYKYIPFWDPGFIFIEDYYLAIEEAYIAYNRRWFDKGVTIEYYK